MYFLNQVFIDFLFQSMYHFFRCIKISFTKNFFLGTEKHKKNNISKILTPHELTLFSSRASKPRGRGGIQAGGAQRERKSTDTATQIPGSTQSTIHSQYTTQLHSNTSTQSMARGVGRKRGRPPKVCLRHFLFA